MQAIDNYHGGSDFLYKKVLSSHEKQIMNLKSRYVEEKNSKW